MLGFKSGRAVVDPRQARIAQGVTGALAIIAIALGTPWPLAIALALVAVALVAPRRSPVAWAARRVLSPASELEPVAPVRFSQLLAVVFLGLSIALWAAGLVIAAMVIAGLVAGLAALSALTGLCVGCEIYRLALAARRGAADLREPLGLTGSGPWLVVLTAPGCARCEPAARRLAAAAGDRTVVRVNLAERPEAAAAPVRSLPGVLAIDPDGHVLASRAGAPDEDDLRAVVSAVESVPGRPVADAEAPALA